MVYPSTLSSFTDPSPTDRLSTTPHSAIETAQNSGIKELQAFVGSASSVAGTLIYDIRATASDGGGHVQTANKGGTGLTAYTKGDILVATSSSVLAKLAVSSVESYALITDSSQAAGVKWGLPGGVPPVRFYQAPSSVFAWVKPSIFSYIVVEVVGAGGGSNGETNPNLLGQGGGHGGYGRAIIPASAIGTASVVGVTGAAGGGGSGSAAGPGSVGGMSRFGGYIIATGGAPGTSTEGGGKGADGSVIGGNINITGGGGRGGPSVSSDSSGDVEGIAGQPGYVTITEY